MKEVPGGHFRLAGSILPCTNGKARHSHAAFVILHPNYSRLPTASPSQLFYLSDHLWFFGRDAMVQRQLYASLRGSGRLSVNVTLGSGRLADETVKNETFDRDPKVKGVD
jgi:hypothetical protein